VAAAVVAFSKPTSWWRRFAAPKPVGPAPMTRTSTELRLSALIKAAQEVATLTCLI